ncbi:MAG: Hpt domain-containing protein [Gemmatimonadetes bacterium]|nr:Hpt domain-containing protein [Gemmatimonadota bacterium]
MSEIPDDVRAALDGLRSLGGPDLLRQMVIVFIDYSAERIQAMQTAVATGDLVAASAAAHALKGSSRQLGLLGMGDACVAVEEASKQGDVAAARTHTAAVYAQYTTAVEWLKAATA